MRLYVPLLELNPCTAIRLEIGKLREDTKRTQIILDMAISSGSQDWAIPFLQEQLKASKELLAFVMQNEPGEAA